LRLTPDTNDDDDVLVIDNAPTVAAPQVAVPPVKVRRVERRDGDAPNDERWVGKKTPATIRKKFQEDVERRMAVPLSKGFYLFFKFFLINANAAPAPAPAPAVDFRALMLEMQRNSEEHVAKVVATMMKEVAAITATFVAAYKQAPAATPVAPVATPVAPVATPVAPVATPSYDVRHSRKRSRSQSVEDRRHSSRRWRSPERRHRRDYY